MAVSRDLAFQQTLPMIISPLPPRLRLVISQIIAVVIYWLLARFAALVERAGFSPAAISLEPYRNRNFYVMRTDAYDWFCTRREQPFTRGQIEQMLADAGFDETRLSNKAPPIGVPSVKNPKT
ncbi:hypothetical protein [Bradyrhizobium retamae]|uniref:hypothetical protein n=1 Tax=Bradyrhizobium retamae TaxID=1300035 RepID=UPI001FDA2A6A|nr:hypothetical protein [Bradyrhizobium retamae]